MRVAFATNDWLTVNEHFGWGRRFILHDVSKNTHKMAGKITFDSGEMDEKGNDDKLSSKIEALRGCHIVYAEAIGGTAAARLTREKIQPMVVKGENDISKILEQLKEVLGKPGIPPWLRKLTREEDIKRFERFDAEADD
ncbi:MAG: nitrogen fixation protein NifX [Nitrospinae bacterium]|nr:nitrogen fixation protein NifX [Nitrospinota bacterium]